MYKRILSFIVLMSIGYGMSLPVFLVAAVVYAFIYDAYELPVLAAFIDANFGGALPLGQFHYLIPVALIVLVAQILKPHLRVYETRV